VISHQRRLAMPWCWAITFGSDVPAAPRNPAMCRECSRYGLRFDAVADDLFCQRNGPSIFLEDNCHGVSVVRPGDSRSYGHYIGRRTPGEIRSLSRTMRGHRRELPGFDQVSAVTPQRLPGLTGSSPHPWPSSSSLKGGGDARWDTGLALRLHRR